MSEKVAKRKAALRDKLIEVATAKITRDGINGLRAREIAQEAGCSLGAIYTHFPDLDALILTVNYQTFLALEDSIQNALNVAGEVPIEQLIAMAHAYLHFADAHHNRWRALFDMHGRDQDTAPDWYKQFPARLLDMINPPARALFPDISESERQALVRGLFSSVHGMVLLGLEQRASAVPREQLEATITLILKHISSSKTQS